MGKNSLEATPSFIIHPETKLSESEADRRKAEHKLSRDFGLIEGEARFVREYAVDGNGARAARVAGSEHPPQYQRRALRRQRVQNALQSIREAKEGPQELKKYTPEQKKALGMPLSIDTSLAKMERDAEKVIDKLRNVALVNLPDFYEVDDDGASHITPMKVWTDAQRAAIEGVDTDGDGMVVRVRLHSPIEACKILIQLFQIKGKIPKDRAEEERSVVESLTELMKQYRSAAEEARKLQDQGDKDGEEVIPLDLTGDGDG